MMRVLHLHSGNMYGGVETVMTALARLRACTPDMESSFALCFGGRLAKDLEATGISPYRLGAVRFRWPWQVWRARLRLRRLLQRERFDVVMTHGSWGHALFARAVRAAGLPLVYWVHDIPSGDHWLERRAQRHPPDLVLANSEFTLNLVPRLFPGVPARVQYTFAAPPERAEPEEPVADIRREFGTAPDDVVILIACRLERWKGHPLLLEALGRLAHVPGWRCWVVGGVQRRSERAYWDELQALDERYGIADRVSFLGFRRDVPRLLRAADIHCQPNLEPEPFGLTFLEALQAGVPVVTTDMGGAREIVTPVCGRLVPPGNVEALAAALGELIHNSATRQAMGAAGRLRADDPFGPARNLRSLRDNLADFLTPSRSVEPPRPDRGAPLRSPTPSERPTCTRP